MSKIIKEYRVFSTLDFFTLIFSFSLIAYVATPIVSRNLQSEGISRAQGEMVVLSEALLAPAQLPLLKVTSVTAHASGRGLASVSNSELSQEVKGISDSARALKSEKNEGELGVDPWGFPYHYLFVRNVSGMQTHLIVWTNGPDHQSQTNVKAQLSQDPRRAIVSFQGDDLGSVTAIR